jgi:hypothetical protein
MNLAMGKINLYVSANSFLGELPGGNRIVLVDFCPRRRGFNFDGRIGRGLSPAAGMARGRMPYVQRLFAAWYRVETLALALLAPAQRPPVAPKR